jgi:hypothetical protein
MYDPFLLALRESDTSGLSCPGLEHARRALPSTLPAPGEPDSTST